ncbi:MAG: O-antigen ligase family protein, partial [Proteobacteria bacterium]|nr:O-antigen ligase family protein [Pseudomonadota bacterium]
MTALAGSADAVHDAPPIPVYAWILAALALLALVAPAFLPVEPTIGLALAVGLGLLPIAALVAFRQPFLLCLVFVIFSFFRIHEAFPVLGPLRIPQLMAAPTMAILAWRVLGTRTVKPFWSRELTALSVFFGLVTVGMFFAVNKAAATGYWTSTYVKIFAMVLVIAWLSRHEREFALVSRALVVAGMLVAAVALYNKANEIGLVEGTRVTIGRDIGSVLGDPNDLSLVLLFPLSFAAALMATRTGWASTLLGLVGSIMIVAAIIATQSRGGLLGSVAVAGIFGARMVKSKVVLLSVGGLAMTVLFAAAGISGRASGGAAESGIDESSMGRIYAWGAAWKMALTRPLTGVGLDNFTGNYFFFSDHWDGMNHAVHSTWFGVLGETGFPGIIAFVTMIVLTAITAFRTRALADDLQLPGAVRQVAQALPAGIVGFCISGTFLTQGFTWPFYIQLALVVSTSQFANVALRNATPGARGVRGKPAKARKTEPSPRRIAGPHRADRGSR